MGHGEKKQGSDLGVGQIRREEVTGAAGRRREEKKGGVYRGNPSRARSGAVLDAARAGGAASRGG